MRHFMQKYLKEVLKTSDIWYISKMVDLHMVVCKLYIL